MPPICGKVSLRKLYLTWYVYFKHFFTCSSCTGTYKTRRFLRKCCHFDHNTSILSSKRVKTFSRVPSIAKGPVFLESQNRKARKRGRESNQQPYPNPFLLNQLQFNPSSQFWSHVYVRTTYEISWKFPQERVRTRSINIISNIFQLAQLLHKYFVVIRGSVQGISQLKYETVPAVWCLSEDLRKNNQHRLLTNTYTDTRHTTRPQGVPDGGCRWMGRTG